MGMYCLPNHPQIRCSTDAIKRPKQYRREAVFSIADTPIANNAANDITDVWHSQSVPSRIAREKPAACLEC
tara:strand:+ start:2913 stop:3125 length:213 start_codon:yes stop_codon:yes gene_type:complete